MAYTLYPDPTLPYPQVLTTHGPSGPYTRTLPTAAPFSVTDPGEAELLVSSFSEVSYRPNYGSVMAGETGLLGYWPLDAQYGLTDRSAGGNNASAVGAPTIGGVAGPGVLTATALNGSTQYVTTPWTTRTNLSNNPSAEADLSNFSGNTVSRVASWRSSGSWAVENVGTNILNNDSSLFHPNAGYPACSAGDRISVSVQLKIGAANTATGTPPRLIVNFDDGSGSFGLTSASAQLGAWPVVGGTASLTISNFSAPAGATRLRLRMLGNTSGTQTVDILWDEILVEKATAVGPYFDGSGYYDANGTWVPASGTLCGWGGTAHISNSQIGPFANGTARTYEVWAQRASGVAGMLLGGRQHVSIPYLEVDASGNVNFDAQAGAGSSNSWTGAWGGNGIWNHILLSFNEPTDATELFVNGISRGALTLTDQFATTLAGDALQFGNFSDVANEPWNGYLAHPAVYSNIVAGRAATHYAAGRGVLGL